MRVLLAVNQPEVKQQRIIAWWSASGGEGKTTLAVSQAYQLAKTTGENVALLDFREANPACHYWYNLIPEDSIEIINVIEKGCLNQKILEDNMLTYSELPNLKIFTGVDLYRFSSWSPKYFDLLLGTLKYPYIVVDTNAGLFFSGTISAIQGADIISVVVEPTYKSIKESNRWIDFIKDKWGVPQDKFRIHFNKLSFRTLDEETLRKGFAPYKIGGAYKFNDSVTESLNKGVPATKGFDSLTEGLVFSKGVGNRKTNMLAF